MDEVAARRLLGVTATASRQEIEAAFRAKALHAHPDRGGHPDVFRSTVEARRLLLTPRRPPPVTVVPDGPDLRQMVVTIIRRLFDREPPTPRVH